MPLEERAVKHSRFALRLHRAWAQMDAAAGSMALVIDAAPGREKEPYRQLRQRIANHALKLKLKLDAKLREPPDAAWPHEEA